MKGKKGRQEVVKPLSGLDIESLLVKHKPDKKAISKENAVPEFKQTLATATADEVVFKAVDEMAEIVRELLQGAGDVNYQRAQEYIKVMREEMIDLEFPDTYNDFIRDFKDRIFKEEFGNRTEFWMNLNFAKLGLIDTTTLPESGVSPDEAKEVRDSAMSPLWAYKLTCLSSFPRQRLHCLPGYEKIEG